MEKAISANIPDCLRAKSQAQSSAWPKLPALWATWRTGKADRPGKADWPKELAWRAEKALTWRGNLKIEFRSCQGLWQKGSKQELPRSDPNFSPIFLLYKPNLSIQWGSSNLKLQSHLFLIFLILSRFWSHLDSFLLFQFVSIQHEAYSSMNLYICYSQIFKFIDILLSG